MIELSRDARGDVCVSWSSYVELWLAKVGQRARQELYFYAGAN